MPDFTKNTALKKLFEELFQGITLDDVFDDVISTKTRNNVRGTKTADTLVVLFILPTSGEFLSHPGEISGTLTSFLTVRTLASAKLGYNKSSMFILR